MDYSVCNSFSLYPSTNKIRQKISIALIFKSIMNIITSLHVARIVKIFSRIPLIFFRTFIARLTLLIAIAGTFLPSSAIIQQVWKTQGVSPLFRGTRPSETSINRFSSSNNRNGVSNLSLPRMILHRDNTNPNQLALENKQAKVRIFSLKFCLFDKVEL